MITQTPDKLFQSYELFLTLILIRLRRALIDKADLCVIYNRMLQSSFAY